MQKRCLDGGQVTGVLLLSTPTILRPSVTTALQELPGAEINETVQREIDRWRERQTEGKISKCVCVCQGNRGEIVNLP